MTRPLRAILGVSLLLALTACSSVLGPKESPTIYAPTPDVKADPAWPAVSWQLGTARPNAPRILDGSRIAVRPAPGELQVYKGAVWASPPSEMLEDVVLHILEDGGKVGAAAREGSGINPDYRLLLDIRHFEADYLDGVSPSAVIEVNAKLVHVTDHAIAGNRTFRQVQPASGTGATLVADAFSQALGTVGRDIAGWALSSGEAHQQQPHR